MTLEALEFEVPRRTVMFHANTEMPDQTLLGYVGDPNSAINGNTPGETLLQNAPAGAAFLDRQSPPYDVWDKVEDSVGGLWVLRGSGGGPAVPADYTSFVSIAGEILGGLRAVVSDATLGSVVYADHTDLSHSSEVQGITKGAAVKDAPVTIVTSGSFSDPSWNWTAGPIFLGVNGILTQIAPTTGFLLALGKAVSPTRIAINIDRPIILI